MSTAREQILQTTCNLLEKQGYHGTGLNEVIKESGSPKGSLYYYFPDGKEQIAAEAVIQSGNETAERIRAGLAERASASEAVYDFVLKIADNVELSGYAAGSPLTAVAMETATQSERINLACREAYGMLQAAFNEKLVASGFTQEKSDELATFIVASIEGGIILSRTTHSADPLRLVAEQLKVLLTL
ncbi:MAG TPA: TetR/AcrR family transcriptional regulator [Anaerolineales bacterium]|nr:TetR/AcrR family transcriptional regulator [Anaerolineales bacterium]